MTSLKQRLVCDKKHSNRPHKDSTVSMPSLCQHASHSKPTSLPDNSTKLCLQDRARIGLSILMQVSQEDKTTTQRMVAIDMGLLLVWPQSLRQQARVTFKIIISTQSYTIIDQVAPRTVQLVALLQQRTRTVLIESRVFASRVLATRQPRSEYHRLRMPIISLNTKILR